MPPKNDDAATPHLLIRDVYYRYRILCAFFFLFVFFFFFEILKRSAVCGFSVGLRRPPPPSAPGI